MDSADQLALALSEWQRKHQIADGDPMLAVLDLVRLAVQLPPKQEAITRSVPPSFEEFRATMELLDTRSKTFVTQSTKLIGELRTFTQTVQHLNDKRAMLLALMFILGVAAGLSTLWIPWK